MRCRFENHGHVLGGVLLLFVYYITHNTIQLPTDRGILISSYLLIVVLAYLVQLTKTESKVNVHVNSFNIIIMLITLKMSNYFSWMWCILKHTTNTGPTTKLAQKCFNMNLFNVLQGGVMKHYNRYHDFSVKQDYHCMCYGLELKCFVHFLFLFQNLP